MINVTWTEEDLKKPQLEITCRCGATYHSHAKVLFDQTPPRSISKTPCPGCGLVDNMWKMSMAPEKETVGGVRDVQTITPGDVGKIPEGLL